MSKPYIGGQAVIEGVMMRSPGCLTVAVRRPDGTIAVKEGPLKSKLASSKIWKLPGFRGVAMLVESMKLGYGALHFSAEQQMNEEEKEQMAGSGKLTMMISVLFALGIFVALPQLMATGTGKLFGIDLGLTDYQFHLIIGGFKLLIFFLYMVGISTLPDVKRVFQYHGAEHKTIHAYEAGLPLTVENVQSQTTLHPRCGTTFLVVVIVISILLGSVTAPLLLPNAEGLEGQLSVLALRIGLLPIIAAISYELQRFTAKYCLTGPLQVLLWPGFLFQKISTREPSDDQVEIAIAAMRTAEWRELAADDLPQHPEDEPLVFETFARFVDALPEVLSSPSTPEPA